MRREDNRKDDEEEEEELVEEEIWCEQQGGAVDQQSRSSIYLRATDHLWAAICIAVDVRIVLLLLRSGRGFLGGVAVGHFTLEPRGFGIRRPQRLWLGVGGHLQFEFFVNLTGGDVGGNPGVKLRLLIAVTLRGGGGTLVHLHLYVLLHGVRGFFWARRVGDLFAGHRRGDAGVTGVTVQDRFVFALRQHRATNTHTHTMEDGKKNKDVTETTRNQTDKR